MSEKRFLDRLSDRAQDSIASGIVKAIGFIAITIGPTIFGLATGSFGAVASFASDETRLFQLVLWSTVFLLAGAAIGFLIRHVAAMRQLRKAREELGARPTTQDLEEANRKIKSLSSKIKEMETSPRYREPESVDELSASKLRLMLRLFDDAENGSLQRVTRLIAKFYSSNLSSLIDMGVVMLYPDSGGLSDVCQLTPKWTGIVRRNRERIEELISSKKHARVDEQLREDLLKSSFRTKDVLLALCDMGSADVTKDLGNELYNQCPEVECYVDFMDVGGGYERWVPKPGVKEAVDALDEVFDPVREDRFSDRLGDPFGIGDVSDHRDVKRSGFERAIDNVVRSIGPSTTD